MHSLSGDFYLYVNITKIEELLSLENPHYKEILQRYSHLQGIHMDDDDEKELLPIHLILGANDYAKIEFTRETLRERVYEREFTRVYKLIFEGSRSLKHSKFGWSIISLGCLAVNSATDFDSSVCFKPGRKQERYGSKGMQAVSTHTRSVGKGERCETTGISCFQNGGRNNGTNCIKFQLRNASIQ
jgi:hypothetical protein